MFFLYNSEIDPKISVIVPVYNTEKYISRCLDSLLCQNFDEKYEIIIIDDGSTDNSPDLAAEYAMSFKNVKLYSQENGGLSAARNTGLEHARGKYIAFVDSDDYVDINYLSEMYEAAESSEADIVCCNFRCVDENGDPSGIDGILKHRPGVFEAKKMLSSLLLDVTVRSFAWNKLYRRDLFIRNNIKFPVGKLYEDLRTTPRLFSRAKKIAAVSGVLYNYVQRKNSITGNMTVEKVFKYIGAYGSVRKILESENIYREYALEYKLQGIKVAFTVIPMLIADKFKDPDTELFKSCAVAVYRLKKYSK